MKTRALKVYYHHPERRCQPPHRTYRPVLEPMPYLRLRGRWMAAAGFRIGDRVQVDVQPGRLIVTEKSKKGGEQKRAKKGTEGIKNDQFED